MGSKADYYENEVLHHLLDANAYLALDTVAANDAGTATEVSGGSYARQNVSGLFTISGNQATSPQVSFPVASADWGAINGWRIMDAATGGNCKYYGTFGTPIQTVLSGNQLIVPAACITSTED